MDKKLFLLNSHRVVPSFVADDEWHHVCLTWSSFGGYLKVFVDGLRLTSDEDPSIDALEVRGITVANKRVSQGKYPT